MVKLSKWIKNNLNISIRNTLDETIKALLLLDPPINKKTVASEQTNVLRNTLKDLLHRNKDLQEEYKPILNTWRNDNKKKNINEKNLQINEKFLSNFKRAIFFSSVIQHAIGGLSNDEIKKEFQERRNVVDEQKVEHNETLIVKDPEIGQEVDLEIKMGRDLELKQENKEKSHQLQIPQRFSFSESEQGAFVEPILVHVEKALMKFVKKHEKNIPYENVESFVKTCYPRRLSNLSDIDLRGLLNFFIKNNSLFITGQSDQTLFHGRYRLNPCELFKFFKIEAGDHNAHAITQQHGRWNDETLQRISTLSLEVAICLGVQDVQEEYNKLMEIRNNFDSELTKRLASTANEKRELVDSKLDELTDLVLDIMNQLESSEKELKRIVQMAISKDDIFLNILRSVYAIQDEDTKIKKFIKLMNILFEMKLKPKRIKSDDEKKR
ncbi:12123_t:CDS:2 [Funneliformis geosporum]|uniref:2354_t:CDS:1 n=1 Tax=Funneliformis geosporum TaxID=1117311 RepID=A0A9W4SHD1_9GLOM|nr:2354_t:CDS:2 [Funneliformis geosporum]CAI2180495.1 12123_t:CDS:2 [Funneliformis geosporum]